MFLMTWMQPVAEFSRAGKPAFTAKPRASSNLRLIDGQRSLTGGWITARFYT